MKLKYYSLLMFFLLIHCSLIAQTKQTAIQKFLNSPALAHASVGICVKDFSGGDVISYNKDKSYIPASILKVITTATILEALGPDYRYQTTLAKDLEQPDRLIIHGYGDPTLGTEYLNNNPNAFLSQWIDKIKENEDFGEYIDVMVIDNYFGYNDAISHKWTYQDIGNYYAAAAYGISIFDNTYKLYFNTSRLDTCPVIVKTEPEIKINFKNTLTLNTSGQDNGYIHGEPLSMNRILSGNIPGGKSSFSIKGDIPNPGIFLAQKLATALNDNGYTIGNIESSHDDYYTQMHQNEKKALDEKIFYTHQSFPLKDIIKQTNVRSNNHYAEHLIRTIGRVKNSDIYSSALDEGIKYVKNYWKNKKIDSDALFMFDGSGLSPANAVSPEFMCDLLHYMQTKSKYTSEFIASLPQAGIEGTVKNRLAGTRLSGKMRMKSGSISGVQCFAGYYTNGDKKYTFALMVNNFTGSRSQLVKAIDQFFLAIF